MALVFRNVKGSALTYTEMDENLRILYSSSVYNATGSGVSSFPYTGSAIISGSLILTGSFYLSGSFNFTASQAILSQTASYVVLAQTASYVISSSYAITSSYVSNSTYLKYGLSGKLFQDYNDHGNNATIETELYRYTLGVGGLSISGEQIEAEYGGIFVSSGTATRQIKLYFAGSVIFDTGILSISLSSAWVLYLTIMRISSSTIRYMISLTTEGAALSAYTSVSELAGIDFINQNELRLTAQASGIGAADNDIVGKISNGFWKSSL